MTKLEELNEELEKLQVQMKDVQKKIENVQNQIEKTKNWPSSGDEYWYIYGDGDIDSSVFDGYTPDIDRLSIGNCFKTKDDAEFARERLKVIAELKKFAMTREEVNAARHNTSIRYLYLDLNDTLTTTGDYNDRTPGVLYFENDDMAWEAVNAVGEERIRKYYLGVDEEE